MPRGDKTGPFGNGAMTGRGAGFCSGSGVPGYANPVSERGAGMGFGQGRGNRNQGFGRGGCGWRNRFNATGLPGWMRFGTSAVTIDNPEPHEESDPTIETQSLKNQINDLKTELDCMRKRLSEVETNPKAE